MEALLTPDTAIMAMLGFIAWLLTGAVKKWLPVAVASINEVLPDKLRGNGKAVERFTKAAIKRLLPVIPSLMGVLCGWIVPGASCLAGIKAGIGATVAHKAGKQMFEKKKHDDYVNIEDYEDRTG